MQETYTCSGCGKDVIEKNIKAHIKNCIKYDSFILKKIKSLNKNDKIDEIQFLFYQLTLAKQHLQSIIQQKKDSQEDDYLQRSQPLKKKQIIVVHNHNKDYKSGFFFNQKQKQNKSNSQIERSLKDPFFYPDMQNQKRKSQEPKINKFHQQKIEIQEPRMGMRQEYRMGMRQEPRMGMRQQKYYGMNQYQFNQPMEVQDLIDSYGEQIIQCPLCKKKFYANYDIQKLQMIEQCWHMCCKVCIKKYVEDQFLPTSGFPTCPKKQCENKIPQHQTKLILGARFQTLQNKIMSGLTNIVECIKCKSQYDFVPGNPNDAPKKDQSGKPLKSQDAILYAQQRFVCPKVSCKTQQCKECHASPYHLGMNCKQFKSRALMKKCRYCNEPITDKNKNKNSIPVLSDICISEQCQVLAKNACTKLLPCSHPCSGVKNQKKCLPCLQQNCCQKQPSLKGQKGSDYCSICYYDGLQSAPSIQCGCGHIFHFHCLKKRMQVKWLTPRILFNFCLCPLCKAWLQVPPQNQLYNTIKQMKQLHDKIEKMAVDRLKFQECDKDQKLTNKDSPYFNKPKEYAMAIYAYFMCFKCKKPYFGGRKNCAEVMNNAQNAQGYNQKELICPGCCDIPIDNCPKHGNDFIEFKCKFCCSIAQWFCWGNTHFCEPCHKKQCNGDYVSKYTKDQLPKCQGPGKCPIGGKHGENGEQKMLGCAICRNYKQNSKNF